MRARRRNGSELGHLEVFEREDHRLGEKHPAGLFVDGGGDDVGVDRQALLLVAQPVHLHLHRGVLGGQEGAQVFIQDEHHLDLSYARREKTGRCMKRKPKKKKVDFFVLNEKEEQ